jgi:hypothetical protein
MWPPTVLQDDSTILQMLSDKCLELFATSGVKTYSILQWSIVPLFPLILVSPENLACRSRGLLVQESTLGQSSVQLPEFSFLFGQGA